LGLGTCWHYLHRYFLPASPSPIPPAPVHRPHLRSSQLDSCFINVSLTTFTPPNPFDPPLNQSVLQSSARPCATAEIDGFANLCQALTHVSSLQALLVLYPSTGEFLEHPQLRQDPHYKATWDISYANELGRLCQGIGMGSSPNTKPVAGTNTFFLIK
jgi:hypothetical protein